MRDSNSTGQNNSYFGSDAGFSQFEQGSGSENVFVGASTGPNNGGSDNTFIGYGAGGNNGTGSNNVFIGASAEDANIVGSYNIYIGPLAGGSGDESNTIRIGAPSFQNTAYIAGVWNASPPGGVLPVYVNDGGQLGVQTSSRRFKEQIADMGDSSTGLLKLRPVTFLYKPEYDKGKRTLQYGLIAEEVADVYPEMVAYDKDGQPYTVKYQLLAPMLLNELQKQYRRAEAQAEVIQAQERQIESLKQQLQLQNASLQQRLQRLESYVETQMKTASDVRPATTVSANGGVQ